MRQTVLMLLVLLGSGCAKSRPDRDLADELRMLKEQIAEMSVKSKEAKSELDELRSKVWVLDRVSERGLEAEFSPGDKGYQVLKTSVGLVAVCLKGIRPYANGQQVTFEIGNTLAATITEPEIRVKWGKAFDVNEPGRWKGSLQEKTEKTTRDLAPGAWTRIDTILSPATPDDTGYIALSLYMNSMSLRVSR